jgi:hypothetical protein
MTLPKYLRQKLDSRTYPVLISKNEKHETVYYLATTREQLVRVFVAMLKRNYDSNYYYSPDKPRLVDAMFPEQAAALPPEYRKLEEAKIARNKRESEIYAEDLEKWATIKKALKDEDGELAFQILHDRKDAEYEGWDFERLEDV